MNRRKHSQHGARLPCKQQSSRGTCGRTPLELKESALKENGPAPLRRHMENPLSARVFGTPESWRLAR